MQVAFAAEKEQVTHDGGKAVSETISQSARFDLKDIKDDRYALVGRLSLRRQFLGTRATPHYQDVVQFHCFNGDELKFLSFTDPELESRLSKRLANGRALPAMLTVRFERKLAGHDGINMRVRLVAHIEACKPTTAESICAAAEAAGFDAADSERYKAALDPDFEKDGIAVSLGKISVRSKVTPRGSALGIHGIRVFNTTSKVVTIGIIGLSIEQEGVSQRCVLNKRTRAPQSWDVEAGGWSDGIYEKGKMPGILWMFDRSGPIEPEKKVKVQLEFKLNGSDPIILTRIVDPI
jgi:hypothetical protein